MIKNTELSHTIIILVTPHLFFNFFALFEEFTHTASKQWLPEKVFRLAFRSWLCLTRYAAV